MNVPFLEHAAVVQGRAAVVLDRLLADHLDSDAGRRAVAELPPALADELTGAIRAVELAAAAWRRRAGIAENGNQSAATATPSGADCAHSAHDLDVAAVMVAFGVGERQARNLAAALGRKVGGRWLVDAHAVADELARRGVA